MSNTKHARGPVARGLIGLCQMAHGTTDIPTDQQLVDMLGLAHADLRVFDAAPDLLLALEWALRNVRVSGNGFVEEWAAEYNAAHAAIAKATGEGE